MKKSETVQVVLMTRESAFKKYAGDRHDVESGAYNFAREEKKIHPETEYGVYSPDTRTFVIVREFIPQKDEALPFVCVRKIKSEKITWV